MQAPGRGRREGGRRDGGGSREEGGRGGAKGEGEIIMERHVRQPRDTISLTLTGGEKERQCVH